MIFVRSNNISLKYQRFAKLGSKDIGMRKSEFVAKTQFLIFGAFLGILANISHFLQISLSSCKYLAVLANISQFLQCSFISCKYLSVFANISQFLQISLSSCRYLSVLANISQFLQIYLSSYVHLYSTGGK